MDDAAGADPEALLARVAVGDREALGTLFSAEAGRLVSVARRIVKRADLAEEVVQETFVTVWQKAPAYSRDKGAARGWMTTIARNKALNMVRDGGRVDHTDGETLAALSEASDADNAYAALADTQALKQCLGRLEPERRRCILLAYVEGFSHEEIAERLKSPVGTVKSWIRRSVVALQECLS